MKAGRLIAIARCFSWPVVACCFYAALPAAQPVLAEKAAEEQEQQPRAGRFETRFDRRHDESTPDKLMLRFQTRNIKEAAARDPRLKPEDYDIGDESFQVYVPEAYTGEQPYGLLVFISAGERGDPGDRWREVLDNHKLIAVSPDNIGDRRNLWARFGLPLDAVVNMSARYNIDPDRVYVSGFSKGGRISSQLGLVFADVFDGAMPIDGCDWFVALPVPGGPNNVRYRARMARPRAGMMRIATRENRYVLMTGEHDGNRDQTRTIYKSGYERRRFKHAHYLEVPGKGHAMPDAEWFEKGVELLDKPLAENKGDRG